MDFDVEPHSNCSYDYVALYDGISEQDPLIGKTTVALCTIFTILLTIWNSEQKNGQLIKLFCFSSEFDETWRNCSTHW